MEENEKNNGIGAGIILGTLSVVCGIMTVMFMIGSVNVRAAIAVISYIIGKVSGLSGLIVSIIASAKDSRVSSMDVLGIVLSSMGIVMINMMLLSSLAIF